MLSITDSMDMNFFFSKDDFQVFVLFCFLFL